MSQKKILEIVEAKKKLMELEKYISSNVIDDPIYGFGRFLAERLNPELAPEGFVLACELALYDLQSGVDRFTQEPIRNGLVGYPPVIYTLLGMKISEIAEAIFPTEFAEAVARVQKK